MQIQDEFLWVGRARGGVACADTVVQSAQAQIQVQAQIQAQAIWCAFDDGRIGLVPRCHGVRQAILISFAGFGEN